ncbi:hypothetical protein C8Q73DRAFT_97250 [Cubamyces lactineus]|nr:hypothetical protein C8Q73DRAFT_97250 [Cubamyces lactineus]
MSTKAQDEKDKGNEAFKAGDYPKAIGHYTAAFIADPSNPTYPLNRAAAYLKLGKNEDAERDCDTVLRLDSKSVKGLFRRGQARVALQKLKEAEQDFLQVLKLDSANAAAKQELQKVQDALAAIPTKLKQRVPIDIPAPIPSSSGLTSAPSTKRRRVPIQIVDPNAVESARTPSSSVVADDTLLKPVVSRPLKQDSTQPSIPIGPLKQSEAPRSPQSGSSSRPQTFREAKATREDARPRGGIFRADGTHKLFTPSQNGNADAPKREPPQTLVAFMRIWNTLTTEEERWDVLRQIPASRLPVLFKTSLDPSILAAILHSLRVALEAAPEDSERLRVVRAYMVNLPRVPRFGTVSLMMSTVERQDVQTVWDVLGRYHGEGVEGEMEKRKEEGSRAAWGCS